MAQIRDVQTSELLFEGSPDECVAMADKLGSVLYDGVSPAFDPEAVRTGAEADGGLPEIPAGDVDEAEQARAAARARVDERRGGPQ